MGHEPTETLEPHADRIVDAPVMPSPAIATADTASNQIVITWDDGENASRSTNDSWLDHPPRVYFDERAFDRR